MGAEMTGSSLGVAVIDAGRTGRARAAGYGPRPPGTTCTANRHRERNGASLQKHPPRCTCHRSEAYPTATTSGASRRRPEFCPPPRTPWSSLPAKTQQPRQPPGPRGLDRAADDPIMIVKDFPALVETSFTITCASRARPPSILGIGRLVATHEYQQY
jgi:hypothetical protein